MEKTKEKKKSFWYWIIVILGIIILGNLFFGSNKTSVKEKQLEEALELLNVSEGAIDFLIARIENGGIVNGYLTEDEAMAFFIERESDINSAKVTIKELATDDSLIRGKVALIEVELVEARMVQKKEIFIEDLVLARFGRVRDKDKFGNFIYN